MANRRIGRSSRTEKFITDVSTSSTNIGIGDDTDYIRLNASTGKIEFGGTMRPTRRVRFQKIAGTAVNVYSSGAYPLRFQDATNEWVSTSMSDSSFEGIDTSADMSLILQCCTDGIPTGSVGVFEVSCVPHGNGDDVSSATSIIATGTQKTLTGIDDDYIVEQTIHTWSGGALPISSGEDGMTIFFEREGADANDTLGRNLHVYGIIVEFRVKEIGL